MTNICDVVCRLSLKEGRFFVHPGERDENSFCFILLSFGIRDSATGHNLDRDVLKGLICSFQL